MRLRKEDKKENSRDRHKKPEQFARLKKFGRKLARYALIPATALALSYAPAAKDLNPFRSKPALAQEEPADFCTVEDCASKKEVKNVWIDSDINLGGHFASNETGAAVSGIADYKGMVGLNFGYLSYYGGVQTPFLLFKATPNIDINGFKLYYNGSLMFARINSFLYTYQGVGVGYNAKLPHDLKLNFGATAGGALGYPKFDNIHFKMMFGTSFGWKDNVTVYGIVETYFAADTAIKTSYALNYRPKFQSVEAGFVGKYKRVFGVVFAKYDVIQSIYGAKAGATIEFTDRVVGNLWMGGGVSRYTNELAGTLNFMLLAGLRVNIKSYINTDWQMSHEQYGPGGTPMLPVIDSPPYYGEITPYDSQAKSNVIGIDNFEDFSESYSDASKEELMATARWLSRTIEQIGYDLKSMDDLMQMKFFSPRIQWIADTSYQDIYHYTHAYLTLMEVYGSYDNIPEDLRNQLGSGIAMCTGIHSLTAKFLNDNGIHAIAASVNAPGGGHVITLGMTKDNTFIIDYGDYYETDPNSMAKILETYAIFNGIPTFYSQMFGDKGYIGTYKTDAARLLEKVMENDQEDHMKSFILAIPGH